MTDKKGGDTPMANIFESFFKDNDPKQDCVSLRAYNERMKKLDLWEYRRTGKIPKNAVLTANSMNPHGFAIYDTY